MASRFALVGVFAANVRDGHTRGGNRRRRRPFFACRHLESCAVASGLSRTAINGHGIDATGLSSDIHAEAAFRAHLITVMGKRAVVPLLRQTPNDEKLRTPMSTSLQGAAARAAPQSLARLSAQQIVEGYRTKQFSPRDVIDETITALESTDALCKVIATEMFTSARAEADRAGKGVEDRRSEGPDRRPGHGQGPDLRRGHAWQRPARQC